jgi:hypothetical protein
LKNLITILLFVLVQNKLIAQVTLTSSNLPIVKINTLGNIIVDDPKVMAHISVINNAGLNFINDPANDLVSYIAIEIRGSSSQFFFPKKSFGLEIRDSLNTTTAINKTFLGMPAESDWILYAPYTDKTFFRDILTHTLFTQMGQYSPRSKFVELVVNGNYLGVYIAEEKIKRDSNRVNIAKMLPTDSAGANLTGGYILKIDKATGTFNGAFQSNITNYQGNSKIVYFQYDYPATPTFKQQNYIKSYVDSFEQTLMALNWQDPINGYRKFININSFIDFFLLNELGNNVDGYRLSTYLHKKKITNGDGKLHMGPIWDFNLAYRNADYCDGWRTDSWAIYQPCNQENYPFWWDRLFQDTSYTKELKCRYKNYRKNILSEQNIFAQVDSFINKVGVAATVRNYTQWPIIGSYVWPNFYVGNSYAEEVDSFKSFITQRLTWMDANMPGDTCITYPLSNAETNKAVPIIIFPTVCTDYVTLQSNINTLDKIKISIYNIAGVFQKAEYISLHNRDNNYLLNVSHFTPGSYYIICKNADDKTIARMQFFKQ